MNQETYTQLLAIRCLTLYAYNYDWHEMKQLGKEDWNIQHQIDQERLNTKNFLFLFYDLPVASQLTILEKALQHHLKQASGYIKPPSNDNI